MFMSKPQKLNTAFGVKRYGTEVFEAKTDMYANFPMYL